MEDLGAVSLIPTVVVFVLAIITHRPIESLISGSIVGLIIIHGAQFIGSFAETSDRVMTDDDVAWVIPVCGFMGSLIGILIRTGSTSAFTDVMGRYVKSRADMTLVIGATLSASTFGSHACFYSDATVLTAQASGCPPMQHALTQFPYALIAALITIAGFLLLAYW